MKKSTRSLIALALASAAIPSPASGAEAPPSSAVRAGPDVDAIRAIGRRWRELYTSGRFAEIPDLYTVDTMVMPRGRPRIEGRKAMRRSIGGLAAGRRVSIDVAEREAFVAGDYGWFVGDFRVTYAPTDPTAKPVTELGRSLVIFRRDGDGRWRIHRDMDNLAPLPEAETTRATTGAGTAAPAMWDLKRRTVATACDRLASSRYDRTRLAKPVARDDIDVPTAIAQCEADLREYPGDARLHFHLGRLYGYAGDRAKTLMHRQAAAAAGNHNAIFLLGYLGWAGAKDDSARCDAAREMKLAADRGNYSGQLTYASYYLEDRLAACPDRASPAEVAAYLSAARPAVDGFFETRLTDHLLHEQSAGGQPATRATLAAALPVVARHEGVWCGVFRRFDPNGRLAEIFSTEITVRLPKDGPHDYDQTNRYMRTGKPDTVISTQGRFDGERIRFENPRVKGWAVDDRADENRRNVILFFQFLDGTGAYAYEAIQISADARRRHRVAQYFNADGSLQRRTLIDETRATGAACPRDAA